MHSFVKKSLLVLLLAYILIASSSALTRGRREQVVAGNDLKQARNLLLSDPLQSSKLFTDAGIQASNGLNEYQHLPWWSKILLPIPPFRYRVQLLQGYVQLASAGQQTISLGKTLPILTNPSVTDTSSLITFIINTLFTWYGSHLSNIDLLNSTISNANDQFSTLPKIAISGSDKKAVLEMGASLKEINRYYFIFSAESSARYLHPVIYLYQNDSNHLAVTIAGKENQIAQTTFTAQLNQSKKAAGLIYSSELILYLLSKTGTLTVPGVGNLTVSLENYKSISPADTANALTTYYLEHPEKLSDFASGLNKYPPQLLET